MNAPVILDRRRVLAGGGALIVSFSLSDAFAQDQARRPRRRRRSLRAACNARRSSIPGFASMPTAASRCSPARPNSARVSRPPSSRSPPKNSTFPLQSLKVVTADTSLTANEGYTSGSHSMQDSGTAIQNAAAQVRELLIAEAARRLDLPAENLRTENGAVIAPDGRRSALRRSGRGRHAACAGAAEIEAEGSRDLQGDGPVGAARRYPGQGHGRCGLCPGHAAARHGACPRRAAAELWRAIDGLRHLGGRKTARRRQGGSRRQFPRRGRATRNSRRSRR